MRSGGAKGRVRVQWARQTAIGMFVTSLAMLVPAAVSLLPGVSTPGGVLGHSLFAYFFLAGGILLLGGSLYLFRPGVAEGYDQKLAVEMAKPVADQLRRTRNIAIVLAVLVLVEIPLVALAWSRSSYEGEGLAVSALGTTLLLLILVILSRSRLAQGKVP